MNASTVRALCCVCGNLRTVSSNYRRGHVGDAQWSIYGFNRALLDLKCSNCDDVTQHAYLRDAHPHCRDIAEDYERGVLTGYLSPYLRQGTPLDWDQLTDEYNAAAELSRPKMKVNPDAMRAATARLRQIRNDLNVLQRQLLDKLNEQRELTREFQRDN